ncbi:MAG: DUF433 domain-containing protein [Planctomycetes bacterium]|nr:DUF433 domain-containing protein [Planctomycetota bacterium]
MTDKQLLDRIQVDPKVMAGKPTIRGTRLTVDFILGLLARGSTEDEILAEYAGLELTDLKACLLFGAQAVSHVSFLPLSSPAEGGLGAISH